MPSDPSSMAGVGMAIAVEKGKVVYNVQHTLSSRATTPSSQQHTHIHMWHHVVDKCDASARKDNRMRCVPNRAYTFITLALSAVTDDITSLFCARRSVSQVMVAGLAPGAPADKSEKVNVGDEIVVIDNTQVLDLSLGLSLFLSAAYDFRCLPCRLSFCCFLCTISLSVSLSLPCSLACSRALYLFIFCRETTYVTPQQDTTPRLIFHTLDTLQGRCSKCLRARRTRR